mmetsp:Transcript_9841/g.30014  ORF Transcript_9841/g.30014 Transcript_9841/m.30014 type:complete len:500 (+) Transcript_9841:340-1839(+)
MRLLHVQKFASARLEDVTLEGGLVEGHFGGGILNEGSLVMHDCHVAQCKAQGSHGEHARPNQYGGGGGQAGLGGGIFSSGSFTALRCTFSDNISFGGLGGSTAVVENEDIGGGLGGGNRRQSITEYNGSFSCGGCGGDAAYSAINRSPGGVSRFGGGCGGNGPVLRIDNGLHPAVAPNYKRRTRHLGGKGGFSGCQCSAPGGGGAALGGAIFLCEGESQLKGCTFVRNVCIAGSPGKKATCECPAIFRLSEEPAGYGDSLGSCVFSVHLRPRIKHCVFVNNYCQQGDATFAQDERLRKTCLYCFNEFRDYEPICKNFRAKVSSATGMPIQLVDHIFTNYCHWQRKSFKESWRFSFKDTCEDDNEHSAWYLDMHFPEDDPLIDEYYEDNSEDNMPEDELASDSENWQYGEESSSGILNNDLPSEQFADGGPEIEMPLNQNYESRRSVVPFAPVIDDPLVNNFIARLSPSASEELTDFVWVPNDPLDLAQLNDVIGIVESE